MNEEIFKWEDFGNDIFIGTYDAKSEARELSRPKRKRNWSREYDKRVLAGAVNKIKTKE